MANPKINVGHNLLSDSDEETLEQLASIMEVKRNETKGAKQFVSYTTASSDASDDASALMNDPEVREQISREASELGDPFLDEISIRSTFVEANIYLNREVQKHELIIARAHEKHAMIPMECRTVATRNRFLDTVKKSEEAIVELEKTRSYIEKVTPFLIQMFSRVKYSSEPKSEVECIPSDLEKLFPGDEVEDSSPVVIDLEKKTNSKPDTVNEAIFSGITSIFGRGT